MNKINLAKLKKHFEKKIKDDPDDETSSLVMELIEEDIRRLSSNRGERRSVINFAKTGRVVAKDQGNDRIEFYWNEILHALEK